MERIHMAAGEVARTTGAPPPAMRGSAALREVAGRAFWRMGGRRWVMGRDHKPRPPILRQSIHAYFLADFLNVAYFQGNMPHFLMNRVARVLPEAVGTVLEYTSYQPGVDVPDGHD